MSRMRNLLRNGTLYALSAEGLLSSTMCRAQLHTLRARFLRWRLLQLRPLDALLRLVMLPTDWCQQVNLSLPSADADAVAKYCFLSKRMANGNWPFFD